MRDLLPTIENWRHEGKQVALATIVQAYGSGLRPLGAKMAVSSAGDIAGSVSGGCVEGAVVDEAQRVIKGGPPRRLEYGIANEAAWGIGLACGGQIQVFVEPLSDEICTVLKPCLEAGRPVALATVVAGPGVGRKLFIWPDGRTQGDLGSTGLNEQVVRYAAERLAIQEPGWATFDLTGGTAEVFVDVFPPLPRLIIVGAVHIAIPLVTMAKVLGFRTIVIDARSAFATRERFPHADELIVEWPSTAMEKLGLDEATYIAIMTHDDKLDIPALQAALASPARYVGILGSTQTHARRVQALKSLGLTDEQLARIHAPIGLRLGAICPEEIALSIMSEVVAVRHGLDAR